MFYNEMTSVKGKENYGKWLELPIAIRLGTKELPPIGPFHDINSLIFEAEESNQLQIHLQLIKRREQNWIFPDQIFDSDDDDDEDDEFGLHNRGAFDAFTDFNKE